MSDRIVFRWTEMEIYMILLNFVRGFAMALANSVPGVSGGTVAFLMGLYDELIN